VTRRATVLVAVAVAAIGLAVGIGVDLIDDGESVEADAGSAARGGVIPDRPCVVAVTVEDPEIVGGGSYWIATVDAEGSATQVSGEATATDPTISPDGESIAYVQALGSYESAGPDATEIWTMGIDGSDPTPIAAERQYQGAPAWSPDGSRVALVASEDGTDEIVVVPATGGAPTPVIETAEPGVWGAVTAMDWSPDGNRLAYTWRGDPERPTEIRTVGVDGSDPQVVTEVPFARSLDWSPDGTSLLVAGVVGLDRVTAVVDVATGERRDLPQQAALGRWTANGSRAILLLAEDEHTEPGQLVDVAVPAGPGAAPDRTISEVGDPVFGMDVGPTC
jgi:TolB protein